MINKIWCGLTALPSASHESPRLRLKQLLAERRRADQGNTDEHTTQHRAEQKAEEHTTEHRADKCKQLLPAKVCSAPVTARVTPSIPIMIIPMILCSSSWLITHFWNINVYRHDNDLYHNDQTPFNQIMGIQHYLKTSIVVVIAKRMRGLVLVVFKHKTGWRKIWGAHRPFAKTPKMHKIGGMPCKIHNRRHHHLARLFAERRPPLLGPAACIRSLGHEKPPALLCIWYQICAHISTAEVLFKWWGQMCVGEVVKRVMSPNVNRWCLMSLTFIWCHWWKLNHACRYIPNCLLADAICISRKKWW